MYKLICTLITWSNAGLLYTLDGALASNVVLVSCVRHFSPVCVGRVFKYCGFRRLFLGSKLYSHRQPPLNICCFTKVFFLWLVNVRGWVNSPDLPLWLDLSLGREQCNSTRGSSLSITHIVAEWLRCTYICTCIHVCKCRVRDWLCREHSWAMVSGTAGRFSCAEAVSMLFLGDWFPLSGSECAMCWGTLGDWPSLVSWWERRISLPSSCYSFNTYTHIHTHTYTHIHTHTHRCIITN